MRNNSAFLFLFVFILFACTNTTSKPERAGGAVFLPESQEPKTVNKIEPLLFKADSLQVVYYDNPGGDSLRYTRFFTLTETADTAQIKALLNEMNQVYVQEPGARACRSEGKLFLLRGEDILKTAYFSTRGDSCTYFYFIKDGSFIYFPLTETAANWLRMNKQKARKPAPTESVNR
jgi:hypothetical protein